MWYWTLRNNSFELNASLSQNNIFFAALRLDILYLGPKISQFPAYE